MTAHRASSLHHFTKNNCLLLPSVFHAHCIICALQLMGTMNGHHDCRVSRPTIEAKTYNGMQIGLPEPPAEPVAKLPVPSST